MRMVKIIWDGVNWFIKFTFTCICVLGMVQYGDIVVDIIGDAIDNITDHFKDLTSE